MANMISPTDESQGQRSSPTPGADLASKLSQGASEATEHALERVHRTRDRLQEELAERRSRFSVRIRDVSEALEGAGRKLGDDDFVADGLHYISEKIERVASYVEDADPNRLADDLRGAMRERPAWFFGGAFVMGLALGRFAKSSAATLEVAEGPGEGTARATRASAFGPGHEQGRAPAGVHRETSPSGPAGQEGGAREGSSSAARPLAPPNRDQGARQP